MSMTSQALVYTPLVDNIRDQRPAPDRLATLLREIEEEFPDAVLIPKAESATQKCIHYFLCGISLGKMRSYLENYHTTLGKKIYLSGKWPRLSPCDQYVVLRHERIHLRQFRRYTFGLMALIYLTPWGRTALEKEAYAETIRAAAEVHGIHFVKSVEFREHLIRQFTGPSYLWMCPFPGRVTKWYKQVIHTLGDKARAEPGI